MTITHAVCRTVVNKRTNGLVHFVRSELQQQHVNLVRPPLAAPPFCQCEGRKRKKLLYFVSPLLAFRHGFVPFWCAISPIINPAVLPLKAAGAGKVSPPRMNMLRFIHHHLFRCAFLRPFTRKRVFSVQSIEQIYGRPIQAS